MKFGNIISISKIDLHLIELISQKEHGLKNYEDLPDFELTTRTNEGDENAFEEIVRRYSPRVFRFASRFFRQQILVE